MLLYLLKYGGLNILCRVFPALHFWASGAGLVKTDIVEEGLGQGQGQGHF